MNGLLVLDKPAGMTSHDVVYAVRRATGEKSVGHLGTLDPMATGVLPLLLGKYTRLAQFFKQAQKSYTGTIRFGFATDTYDAEGVAVSDAKLLTKSLDELRLLAKTFLGESMQMPPVYSAKKIDGQPAYKMAREGKAVELKAARVLIDEFSLIDMHDDTASFAMTISAGGYVRSVAHELGAKAGCGAHLASLRRTAAGCFTLDDSMTVEAMRALAEDGRLEESLPHPRMLLPEMPCVTVDAGTAVKLRNGMTVGLAEFSGAPLVKIFTGQRELLGIGKRIAGALVHPMVMLG